MDCGVSCDRSAASADSDIEGEELKEWRPATEGSGSLSDLPQEPEQANQSRELQGAASLGSSAAYELKPLEPHVDKPEDPATLRPPHHV